MVASLSRTSKGCWLKSGLSGDDHLPNRADAILACARQFRGGYLRDDAAIVGLKSEGADVEQHAS